jgi:VIT1/CCC1 family predicted Fe2+/Mn2+ transporter
MNGRPTEMTAADAIHTGVEPHQSNLGRRLNWLRAGVLGANDGIVSIAGLVVGVAAATSDRSSILAAGMAGVLAGATSMALGEYVSVSTQRDTERALLAKERYELDNDPAGELDELAQLYVAKGASPSTARQLAVELTAHDAFAAHIDVELGIDPTDLTNPWHAAAASAASFAVGSSLPMLAIATAGPDLRILITAVTVIIALALTGMTSAVLGGAPKARAVSRLIVGGGAAMVLTYLLGQVIGGHPL